MCCEPPGRRGHVGAWAHECCCGPGPVMLFRHCISKKEQLEGLQEYSDQLKKELEGVKERIEELKSKGS